MISSSKLFYHALKSRINKKNNKLSPLSEKIKLKKTKEIIKKNQINHSTIYKKNSPLKTLISSLIISDAIKN